MNALERSCPPVLSCAEAGELETSLFQGVEQKEWEAMQRAGAAIAAAVARDSEELGGLADTARFLVLVGKGHNGGDALIAVRALLQKLRGATADVVFVFGERALRPLASRAWRELVHTVGHRANVIAPTLLPTRSYAVALDGVFGFQFRPPVSAQVTALFEAVNRCDIKVRAAVDLPSAGILHADFTYATGSVKDPLLGQPVAGRVRYLDLGFFELHGSSPYDAAANRVLTENVLDPLRRLRTATSDKRSFGHVFIIGGSRNYPGAILMAAAAALRSGAGLVSAFVPESLVPAFATRLPEVIWIGWPETPDGSLALEGENLLRSRIGRADALVIGPGMGRDPETLALAASVVGQSEVPVVVDADALQPEIVSAGGAPRILTPHAGEYERIAGGLPLKAASRSSRVIVFKGPVTRVCAGAAVYHSFYGGPVLARGGSGDLLAGIVGTQLAQSKEVLTAAARGVVWHGVAADLLARAHGQVAVSTTQLLDFLGAALLGKNSLA